MSPSTAAVLLLASSALAVPLVQRQDLPPDNAKDFDQICGHDDLSTFDLAEQTWEQTAAGYHIDSYIANVKGGNADDWVNNMYLWAFAEDGGTSPMDSCGTLGGCNKDLVCRDFFDKNRASYYWILQGVEGLHQKYETIHEKLQDTTIIKILRINEISDDFSKPPPSNAFASYISAAFVVGAGGISAVGGANPAIAGLMTVIVGIFSGISAGSEPGNMVDTDDLEKTLVNMFNSIQGTIEDNLSLATGNTHGGDYSSLPNGGFTEYDSPVANFFSGGNFLVSENAPEYKDALDAGFQNLLNKLLDVAMQTADIKVMADYNNKSCDSKGYVWLDDIDGGRCFHLVRLSGQNPGNHCGSADNKCRPDSISDDVYDKLTDSYGFDLESYYRGAYACAAAGGGDFDVSNLPLDGSIPTCFYNPRTFKGEMAGKILQNW